jgi:hypothetical protein
MSNLRDLFNKPVSKPLGGVPMLFYRLELRQFDDAIIFGTWLQRFEDLEASLGQLEHLKDGQPERVAMERLIAMSIRVPAEQGTSDQPRELTLEDAQCLPIVTTAEAVALIMEINLDFFIQTLPSLRLTAGSLGSIGSVLLNASSALGTNASGSSDTPSVRS